MEKINTEDLICTLFMMGVDKVDFFLYDSILNNLSCDKGCMNLFEFVDSEPSSVFNEYVYFDENVFRLKDGYTLDSNVSPVIDKTLSLESVLHTNKKLMKYLKCIDFRSIIIKKLYNIGCLYEYDGNFDEISCLFSDKEKDIICDLLKIDKGNISKKQDGLPRIVNMLSYEEGEKYNRVNSKNRILTFK